ncbi:MAG: alpha/beta-type small acid-soluble spore protein [Desulfotomaculaceae bacterium]|nr:alpha/beta-type small acid-soluble spore protein [Desulfotomaculaceae bacterium]
MAENSIISKEYDLIPKEYMHHIANSEIPPELQPFVEPALNNFKNEIAIELLGVDYENIDKGSLPSRMNGSVGGKMVKQFVKFSEAVLAYNYAINHNLLLKDKN